MPPSLHLQFKCSYRESTDQTHPCCPRGLCLCVSLRVKAKPPEHVQSLPLDDPGLGALKSHQILEDYGPKALPLTLAGITLPGSRHSLSPECHLQGEAGTQTCALQ